MAGDWMKIELDLPDKPEVHYIAGAVNLTPACVVGHLIKVWAWFDKHTSDGNAHGVTFALVDRLTGVTGLGECMCLAGWLEQHDKVLHMPKFDRHTSKSAKKRALTAKRQNTFRNDVVTHAALPREEKRRSTTYAQEFENFWTAYPRKQSKGQAEKAWSKLSPNEQLTANILQAVERAKTSDNWRRDSGQFIPYPATWLNAKGWLDEPVSEVPTIRRVAL
jgi:hypothetical protein